MVSGLWSKGTPEKSNKGEKSLGVTLEWPYSSTRLSTSQGFHLSDQPPFIYLNFRISSLRQEELNHFQDPSSIPTDLYHYSFTPWWRQLGKCFLSYISQPVFITKDHVDSNTGYHCFWSTGILSLTMISPINPTPFVFVHNAIPKEYYYNVSSHLLFWSSPVADLKLRHYYRSWWSIPRWRWTSFHSSGISLWSEITWARKKLEVINDPRQIDKPITSTVSQTDPNDEELSMSYQFSHEPIFHNRPLLAIDLSSSRKEMKLYELLSLSFCLLFREGFSFDFQSHSLYRLTVCEFLLVWFYHIYPSPSMDLS